LADATESELNDAAVKGLIEQLQPHVMLGTPAESLAASTNQLVAARRRFRSDYGYLQVGVVKEGLAPELRAAIDELLKEGPLKGLVLDLRFASGADYDAAAAAASRTFHQSATSRFPGDPVGPAPCQETSKCVDSPLPCWRRR
ncbi:MAG: hypothetical protein HC829_06555, partial [Bacteroidales bacterium]|nr:hypothetical protein [Bacteroidales bacterium]